MSVNALWTCPIIKPHQVRDVHKRLPSPPLMSMHIFNIISSWTVHEYSWNEQHSWASLFYDAHKSHLKHLSTGRVGLYSSLRDSPFKVKCTVTWWKLFQRLVEMHCIRHPQQVQCTVAFLSAHISHPLHMALHTSWWKETSLHRLLCCVSTATPVSCPLGLERRSQSVGTASWNFDRIRHVSCVWSFKQAAWRVPEGHASTPCCGRRWYFLAP